MEVKNNKIVVCRLPIHFMGTVLSTNGLGMGHFNTVILARRDINPYVCDIINLETPMTDRVDVYSLSNTGFNTTRRHDDIMFNHEAFFETTDGRFVRADSHIDLVLV